MKYSDYMREHETEGMSWCTPYQDETGDYTILVHDGEPSAIMTPSRMVYRYDGTLTGETLEQFARAVNPDYDAYSNWDDLHIALNALHPIACSACPWFDDCAAMVEEIDETDNR